MKHVGVLLALTLAACRYDAAWLEVTVDGTAPMTTQLSCSITSSVSGHATISVPEVANGPITLPQTFTLKLPTEKAQLTIDVTAGAVSAATSVAITGAGVYHATVSLGSINAVGDMSIPAEDLAADAMMTSHPDGGGTDGGSSSPTGYAYARDFTIHRSAVGVTGGPAVLNDYAVPIQLTDPTLRDAANGGHVQSPTGADIVFTAKGNDCNGGTACTLSSEIVKYDATNGSLAAWVRVPQLATVTSANADSVVTMLYGKPGVTGPLVNPATTWDSGFRGVWHLAKDNDDSTANGHDPTSSNFTSLSSGAIYAGAEAFDGTVASAVSYPNATDLDINASNVAGFSVSTWVKTSTKNVQPAIVSKQEYVPYIEVGWSIAMDLTDKPASWRAGAGGDGGADVTTNNDLSDGEWHMVAFVLQSGTIYAYQDGKSVGSSASTLASATTSAPLVIGGQWDASVSKASYVITGAEEEVRVSAVARSAAWMATDYSLLTSTTAIAVGAERAP